jgi:2-polyprenyl-3-methyl-5-hydroxy-6-metoxy-1,4-benzoquinol methylase
MTLDVPTARREVGERNGGAATLAPDLHFPAHGVAAAPGSCRFCGGQVYDFVDLGMSPLCESFLGADQLDAMEPFYPLRVLICGTCFLAQIKEYVAPERIFREYAYFSAYSEAWLEHSRRYVDMAIERFRLTHESRVVELASNDGYLLQFFVKKGYSVLGIDPAENVAKAAEARGVPTLARFFNRALAQELAERGVLADLIIGNNVLAQVPDLNGFVAGVPIMLKPRGIATFEFPHLLRLIEENQFDTIYHEHFSYFSLMATARMMAAHGLRVFDVEELWTHGGSLRIYVCRADNVTEPTRPAVGKLIEREYAAGLGELATYAGFAERVKETKRRLLDFLVAAKRAGKSIVGYGAPGKGNTLLNYCGIRTDFIDYTVDRNPYKHGKFLPGTHIPVLPTERIAQTRPDYLFILPWNLREEIMAQMAFVREWGGQFVVPIPELRIYS